MSAQKKQNYLWADTGPAPTTFAINFFYTNYNLLKKELIMERKFTEIDEEFICENCGKKVEKLGYSCRNHCNYCLHSKHVDINPGDRLEECHGILEPIGIEISNKKGYVIIYKCKKCGQIRKNKAAKDDDMNLIIKLTVAN